jgi:hypothetical protein
MRDAPQRGVLSIIDGIVAGEGNGPLAAQSEALRAARGWHGFMGV